MGVTHILGGWDHLLFVIALVLLVRRGWAVAKAVTAFTVAHSLTLAGVTLGCFNAWYWFDMESRMIEKDEAEERTSP